MKRRLVDLVVRPLEKRKFRVACSALNARRLDLYISKTIPRGRVPSRDCLFAMAENQPWREPIPDYVPPAFTIATAVDGVRE